MLFSSSHQPFPDSHPPPAPKTPTTTTTFRGKQFLTSVHNPALTAEPLETATEWGTRALESDGPGVVSILLLISSVTSGLLHVSEFKVISGTKLALSLFRLVGLLEDET